ncbi:Kruppel-like factor 15 [Haematobia irritans]|uniref:Kruppel-like factor 15 n=1 Tax=Haematobia irritans TaxID=7368 RepID=UPI003F50BD34
MDFFADGGFHQLYCDLNESKEWDVDYSVQYESCNSSSWDDYNHYYRDEKDMDGAEMHEEPSLYFEDNQTAFIMDHQTPQSEDFLNLTDISDKQFQLNLDYLLNTNSHDSMDLQGYSYYTNVVPDYYPSNLSDWEEKFLDNYIEIPELVDFLPDKTPLCTDTCNHFLQESAENLKIFNSPPGSPASLRSCQSSSPSSHKNPRNNHNPSTKENNDKTYPCHFGDCGKIYAKPAHLKAHLRRHMGEKPYVCTWSDCTWRFSRSDELARHRRSHSGIKPYKCDFCAKCFARSDHLTKHRKVHERRLLAASKAGKMLGGIVPQSVLTVRPGRKRKNQL